MTTPINIAVHGAAGRMGRRVVALAVEDTALNIVAALDNLCKGSSGQAIQNANLMLGLDETAGLMGLGVFP